MRFSTATSIIALAATPALINGFRAAGRPAALRTASSTSTSLAARPRSTMFPILRRSVFPDVDRMFQEVDEMMMETSMSRRFPRPSSLPSSLLGEDLPGELRLRRPLGFDVTQDDKEYTVAVHVPDVDVRDIDLQLDHDGRVLRLRGDRSHEEGGMKVRSRFEKAILLSPDVDTTRLKANLAGSTLTVVAPKIEREEALEDAQSRKIEIRVVVDDAPDALPEAAEDGTPSKKAPTTKLAVENLKADDETKKVEPKEGVEGEKRWPARDFPY